VTERRADGLILFGITGDLAHKRLFPAIYHLAADGELVDPVVGVGRTEGDDADLRGRAAASLVDAGIDVDQEVFDEVANSLCYVQGDYRDHDTYRTIAERLGDRDCAVAYLAIPPSLFDDVVSGLAEAGLHRNGRLVVEKPFGRDTKSAKELNGVIHRFYPEERVYRIDHFLGKEALQNLMVYRFSNTILEPVWNRHYIRGVQITLAEDFGVEGRGSFYDTVGAMRDVVQNHILELVALLAMEPPVSGEPQALRDERVKVLSAAEPFDPANVVRGQYEGYRGEPGVDTDSDTETFFATTLVIDSWRWAGVPWVIRTGKNLADTVTEAVVEFNRPPRMLFAGADIAPGPNRLVFQSKPEDRITLSMRAKEPGSEMLSRRVDLSTRSDRGRGSGPDAYQRLLGDALRGDASLFAREDGVMEAWRIVQPVLDHRPEAFRYKPGSWGPNGADGLLGSDWKWLTPPD
jgi:glucose-6-phosphate 1-dehydrogenase